MNDQLTTSPIIAASSVARDYGNLQEDYCSFPVFGSRTGITLEFCNLFKNLSSAQGFDFALPSIYFMFYFFGYL